MAHLYDSATFHAFSRLPAELRAHVWNLALPDTTQPAMSKWKTGCWRIRPLCPNDRDYEKTDKDRDFVVFNPEMLDGIRYNVTLSSVSQEARDLVWTWADKRGLRLLFHDSSGSVFERSFDPDVDIAFIEQAVWKEDEDQAHELRFSDPRRHMHRRDRPRVKINVRHIALSPHWLNDGIDLREALFYHFCSFDCLKRVSLIMEWQGSGLDGTGWSGMKDTKGRRRWEVGSSWKGTSTWNQISQGFDFKRLTSIDAANISLETQLVDALHKVEIRTVCAIKR
ncbi:hypothetical protein K461DRAFT_55765 [Myriangium duriaei CBS 260.36]|uniref:2EXR domain-containing protein n=1 Tax=Myriangium duriaei CBS 260.36 TaxID=1168546 RepID=A0A9P4IW84_9PEZI|nr:hypothetical protein K461DRAFT_55765 [Myriangium duriaei CBS 260.36]